MGKSKKRNLSKSAENASVVLKRSDVIEQIVCDIKNNNVNDITLKYLNLFGITFEELTEKGVLYEELSSIKSYLV